MKTFFHVTRLDYLDNIMEKGLVPCIGHLSQLIDETEKRIYLFPNQESMENALANWLGETYERLLDMAKENVENDIDDLFGFTKEQIDEMEEIPLCSLKITIPDDFPIFDGETEFECYSYQTISPKFISFFKEE